MVGDWPAGGLGWLAGKEGLGDKVARGLAGSLVACLANWQASETGEGGLPPPPPDPPTSRQGLHPHHF